MTRTEAYALAHSRYGSESTEVHRPLIVVGENPQYRDKPFYVGVKVCGEFIKFGAGASWEEAFAAVVPVRDIGGGKFKALA